MKDAYNAYDSFRKYEVDAESVEDFLEKYTKPSRHAERGPEYVEARIASSKEYIKKHGFTFITHHSSKTGEVVAYYPKC